MWKKLPLSNRERERQIGNPVLVETTYDQASLGRIPNITDAQKSPPISPTVLQAQDRLSPFAFARGQPRRTPEPVAHEDNRISTAPTVSSVYSQPTPPQMQHGWDHRPLQTSTPIQEYRSSPSISPVSGPRHENPPESGDVSPVDVGEHFHNKQLPKVPSHIPISVKSHLGANARHVMERHDDDDSKRITRWDDFSGDPSIDGSTEPVMPAHRNHVPRGSPLAADIGPTYQVSVESNNRPPKRATLAERAARFGNKALRVETKPRDPWKGASGRNSIVDPVQDKPATSRSIFSSSRTQRSQDVNVTPTNLARSQHQQVMSSAKHSSHETTAISPADHDLSSHNETIKPVVPLKVGRTTSPRGVATPKLPNTAMHPYPSPITPGSKPQVPLDIAERTPKNVATHEPSSSPADHPARSSSIYPTEADRPSTPDAPADTSRFSWTTYATNTTYQHSPPPTPPPPMPTLATDYAKKQVVAPHRARESLVSTHRKPVPRISTTSATAFTDPSPPIITTTAASPPPITSSTSPTSKALPPAPPELASVDLVSSLQAQLDDLSLRRNNLSRLLRDTIRPREANPLVADLRVRRELARRREVLEAEIADLGAREHELGLRLHRAWKRREREEGGEGSALWIKRVTG